MLIWYGNKCWQEYIVWLGINRKFATNSDHKKKKKGTKLNHKTLYSYFVNHDVCCTLRIDTNRKGGGLITSNCIEPHSGKERKLMTNIGMKCLQNYPLQTWTFSLSKISNVLKSIVFEPASTSECLIRITHFTALCTYALYIVHRIIIIIVYCMRTDRVIRCIVHKDRTYVCVVYFPNIKTRYEINHNILIV